MMTLQTYSTGKVIRERKEMLQISGLVIVSVLQPNGWYRKYKPWMTLYYKSKEDRAKILNSLLNIRHLIDNDIFVLSIIPFIINT